MMIEFHGSPGAVRVDPASQAETATARCIATRMGQRVLLVGGTISGAHGVGIGKRGLMQAEHGEAWQVMGTINAALDPDNILNPDKLLPDRN